jgi:hypothetical protein
MRYVVLPLGKNFGVDRPLDQINRTVNGGQQLTYALLAPDGLPAR